jgi:hypothetical protein
MDHLNLLPSLGLGFVSGLVLGLVLECLDNPSHRGYKVEQE